MNKCKHAIKEYPYCDAPIPQYANNGEEVPYRRGDTCCTKDKCEAYEEINLCSSCSSNPATKPHTCPFKEGIDEDYETLCTCYAECAHDCAMSV